METTLYFWDCACKENYVHPKTVTVCRRCGAKAATQPDSRITQVVKMLLGESELGEDEPTQASSTAS